MYEATVVTIVYTLALRDHWGGYRVIIICTRPLCGYRALICCTMPLWLISCINWMYEATVMDIV